MQLDSAMQSAVQSTTNTYILKANLMQTTPSAVVILVFWKMGCWKIGFQLITFALIENKFLLFDPRKLIAKNITFNSLLRFSELRNYISQL